MIQLFAMSVSFTLPFGLTVFQAAGLIFAVLLVILMIIFITKRIYHQKDLKNEKSQNGKIIRTLELINIGPEILIGNSQIIGSRENQQDSFSVSDADNSTLCSKKGVFAVVADGMGGLSDGSKISSIAADAMMDYFNNYGTDLTAQQALQEMLMIANEKVNTYLADHENIESGSTAVAVILKRGALSWISVGDSRIYLFRNNRLWLLNESNNLANELNGKVLAGKATRQEAENDAQRNALTCYLGIGKIHQFDANIKPFALQTGDKILLCSDGVFGTLTEEEITSAMAFSAPMAAEEIEKMVIAKEKQSQDNMTAIILEPLRLSI
jgi:serine/threonine protein phosphatase PrpC